MDSKLLFTLTWSINNRDTEIYCEKKMTYMLKNPTNVDMLFFE